MKKKAIILCTFLSLSLSACSFLENLLPIDYSNYNSPVSPISESVDPVSGLKKKTLKYSMNDYAYYSGLDSANTIGDLNILVVPIYFLDSGSFISPNYKNSVKNDITNAILGDYENVGWHSIKSFYNIESHGALKISGTVADWYNANSSYTYYLKDDDYCTKTSNLINKAVDYYFANHVTDLRSKYDSNNDGFLDAVIAIYAAPNYLDLENNGHRLTDDETNLWAYRYWAESDSNKFNPALSSFLWASYDFMYDVSNARYRTGNSYYCGFTGNGIKVDTHTYIHEFGHILGLEDYYDYSRIHNPAGGFSMQDFNVGGHDPYSVMALGWAKPYIPFDNVTIKINDFQSSGDLIILSNNYLSSNSPFDEYLILELYSPSGLNYLDSHKTYFDSYPVGSLSAGIRLWHVNSKMTSTTDGKTYSKKLITGFDGVSSNTYVQFAFSNTNYSLDYKNYCSPLGSAYYDYDLLHLIRNQSKSIYLTNSDWSSSDLFMTGSNFNFKNFGAQFVNNGKLDDNSEFEWSFSVDSIVDNGNQTYSAYITVSNN